MFLIDNANVDCVRRTKSSRKKQFDRIETGNCHMFIARHTDAVEQRIQSTSSSDSSIGIEAEGRRDVSRKESEEFAKITERRMSGSYAWVRGNWMLSECERGVFFDQLLVFDRSVHGPPHRDFLIFRQMPVAWCKASLDKCPRSTRSLIIIAETDNTHMTMNDSNSSNKKKCINYAFRRSSSPIDDDDTARSMRPEWDEGEAVTANATNKQYVSMLEFTN